MPALRNDLGSYCLTARHGRVVARAGRGRRASAAPAARARRRAAGSRTQPVEADAAGDVPREALVDRDLPVRLRADEVRAARAPRRASAARTTTSADEPSDDRRSRQTPRCWLVAAVPPRSAPPARRGSAASCRRSPARGRASVSVSSSSVVASPRAAPPSPRSRSPSLADLEEDDRDVVLAAALVRGVDQRLRAACRGRRGCCSTISRIVVVVDHRRQAVGADHEDVARPRLDARTCRRRRPGRCRARA